MADLILILLWCGERNVKKTIEEGTFFCPKCQQLAPCKQKELWHYFHFYYVPLCPTQKVADYVKCKRCNSRFELAVIKSQDNQTKEDEGIMKEENKKQATPENVAPNKDVPVKVKPKVIPPNSEAPQLRCIPDKSPVVTKKQDIDHE